MEKKNFFRLIPMNINEYNINQLLDEEKNNKGEVLWQNGGKNGNNAQKFYENDIVYIYCKNLPDGSNRILFRAIVNSCDDDNTYSFDKKEKIKGFFIKNIESICINNIKTFSRDTLKNDYDLNINQTKQILASFEDYNDYKKNPDIICKDRYGSTSKKDVDKYKKHLQLILELETLYRGDKCEKSLKNAQKYFNHMVLCECCELLKLGDRTAKKRTFIKKNGLVYYEIHHLLMQNLTRKNDEWLDENQWFKKEDSKWLDSEFNRVNLCPVCHREFHYGNFEYGNTQKDAKKKVIDALWESHQYEKNLKGLGKTKEEIKLIKEYIYNQYI